VTQLEFAAVTRRRIDHGLLAAISGSLYYGRKRRHKPPTCRELAGTYVLPETKVRERVDTLIAYGMVTEIAGVLRATGKDPVAESHRHRGLFRGTTTKS
jgi:hypothetical protein